MSDPLLTMLRWIETLDPAIRPPFLGLVAGRIEAMQRAAAAARRLVQGCSPHAPRPVGVPLVRLAPKEEP